MKLVQHKTDHRDPEGTGVGFVPAGVLKVVLGMILIISAVRIFRRKDL